MREERRERREREMLSLISHEERSSRSQEEGPPLARGPRDTVQRREGPAHSECCVENK